jgi:hypothetical protein
VPKKDQSMGAFGMPTQVLPIVSTSVDLLYDWKAPHRCPILHLVGHHLLDHFDRRCSQCHLHRVTRQFVFGHAIGAFVML